MVHVRCVLLRVRGDFDLPATAVVIVAIRPTKAMTVSLEYCILMVEMLLKLIL